MLGVVGVVSYSYTQHADTGNPANPQSTGCGAKRCMERILTILAHDGRGDAQAQDTPRHASVCKVQGNRKSMKPPTTGQIDQLSSAVLSLSAIVIVEVPAVMARVGAALTGAKRGSAMSPTIWPPRLSWVSAAGRSLLCRDGTPSLWRLGYSQCA